VIEAERPRGLVVVEAPWLRALLLCFDRITEADACGSKALGNEATTALDSETAPRALEVDGANECSEAEKMERA
jgi:hypothetical protein